MPVVYTTHRFHAEELTVELHKVFPPHRTLSCYIVLDTEKFVDFQKDLLQDFLSMVVETLERPEATFDSFKRDFEAALQDLNNKLGVFADKIKDVPMFSLRGVVQIFFDSEYVASMVGSVGVMIVREGKLNYMLSNHIEENRKIDLFSEFVEGETKEGDEIIVLGIPIDTYLDKGDYDTLRDISQWEGTSLIDALVDLLSVRTAQEELGFIAHAVIESSALFTQKKIQRNVTSGMKQLDTLSHRYGLGKYKQHAIYALIWVIIIGLIWWLVQSFLQANEATFTDGTGGVVVDFTIEDIQKDIDMFKKIDPSSDQKIKKYNEIVSQLDILDSNNRRTYDVAELRKILEKDYYEGFNIVLANNDSFFKEPVYLFTQQEKNNFGKPLRLFYTDSILVAGDQWVLLWAINESLRGTLVSVGVDRKIRGCSLNLLHNGLYCHTENDQIYNVLKSGLQPVGNAGGAFPSRISEVDTYGSSNLYALTKDPTLNKAGTYIVRYTNKLGSQENFGEGTQYLLVPPGGTGGTSFASSGFASLAIDGTFLTRSPTARKLYQLWRADATSNLQSRELPLLGWDTVEPYSSDTKVITSADSRYVYLFDKEHQTFTIYRSNPYKTNDANTYTYTLSYFFRIKFALADTEIIDAFVDEGEKSVLYLMTANGIFNMPLYDYIASYAAKDAVAQQ